MTDINKDVFEKLEEIALEHNTSLDHILQMALETYVKLYKLIREGKNIGYRDPDTELYMQLVMFINEKELKKEENEDD